MFGNILRISLRRSLGFIHRNISTSHSKALPQVQLKNAPKYVGKTIQGVKPPEAVKALLHRSNKLVEIMWLDGQQMCYPLVWLRDNCAKIFNTSNGQRTLMLTDWNLDMSAKTASIEDGHLYIEWEDGTESWYKPEFLRKQHFFNAEPRQMIDNYVQELWDTEKIRNSLHSYKYTDVMGDNKMQHNYLRSLLRYGIALIRDAPLREDILPEFAEELGYVNQTHYGRFFTVITKQAPNNMAYTNSFLGLHVDLAACYCIPDFQYLHCIGQSANGGENHFVDGFKIAEVMKHEYRKDYRYLTTTRIQFQDKGKESEFQYYLRKLHYPIKLNEQGATEEIHINNHIRGQVIEAPVEEIPNVYRALRKFWDVSYEPRHLLQIKLEPGDIIAFHNTRVLHGRGQYVDDGQAVHRHLRGMYLSKDVIISRMNVLTEDFSSGRVENFG